MKKTNLILLGVFVILILVFLLVNVGEKKSQRASIPDQFFTADSAQIDKIIVKKNMDDPVTLQKRGNDWYVTDPVDYPANNDFVFSMLDRAVDLEAAALISSNPEKQSLYQVDSTGTDIQFFQGGTLKEHLIVGKTGSSAMTFMRKADSDDVFSIEGYLVSVFSRRAPDWRDKSITKFDKEELQSVRLSTKEDELTISRSLDNPENWDLLKAGDDEIYFGKSETVNRLVNTLSNFNTLSFNDAPDSAMVAKFAEPERMLIVTLQDNTIWNVFFVPKDEAGNRYLVKREDKGDAVYFETAKGSITQIFQKFDDLKGEPPPPPVVTEPDTTGMAPLEVKLPEQLDPSGSQ